MNRFTSLAAAFVITLPIAAIAQTSPNVKPADQPRTQLEADQTTKNGQATKYGAPGTDTGAKTTDSMSTGMNHNGMKGKAGTADKTKPGDAPTYPAPAPDGAPTK